MNTRRVNTSSPLFIKVRKLLEAKLSPYFRHQPVRRRRFEVQLEFPWHSKR